MILWNLLDQLLQDQNVKLSKSKSGAPERCFFYSDIIVFFKTCTEKKRKEKKKRKKEGKLPNSERKTEALEAARKPPFRKSKLREQLATFFCPLETEASYGHCQILRILERSSPLLQEEHHSPREWAWTRAPRGGSLAVCTLHGQERKKLCVLRFFLVRFVFLYEALTDCANIPCLTQTLGQSAHYTSTNRTVAVFTVHTVSIGTVYKESYMKNNINMFNL